MHVDASGTFPLAEATAPRRAVLSAFVRLDLPARLAGHDLTAAEIATSLDAHPLALRRFLDLAVTLGLLACTNARYRCTEAARRLAEPGAPARRAAIAAAAGGAAPWDDELARRLRAWRPGQPRPTCPAPGPEESACDLRAAMVAGEALSAAVDFSARSLLVDLGGGTGGMSIALCRRHPRLRSIVIERAERVRDAEDEVRASGLADRIEVWSGDFTRDPLPGADVALLANVLSMLSVEDVHGVLESLRRTLLPGGEVVVSGWMLDDDETGPLPALLVSVQDIACGEPDVERSGREVADWVAAAGFVDVRHGPYLEPLRYVKALQPGS